MTRHAWLRDAVVSDQLAQVETMLTTAAADGESPFHRQLLSRRSKRLRPALLLLTARFGSRPEADTLICAAAGVEMLHEATLYHDDIVDEADLRRGEVTTHRIFGPAVAALAGSELLYGTAEHFAGLSPRLRRSVGRAVDALCRGQLREIETLGAPDVTVRQRLRIMRDKTARLFALAAHLGATLGGAEDWVVRRLTRFGLQFGMCLQLLDDLRDLVATERQLGRPPGSDLLDGVYTLPVVYGASGDGLASASLRASLRFLLFSRNPAALPGCVTFLRESGGVQRAVNTLQGWIEAARSDVCSLQETNGVSADMLSDLLERLQPHLTNGMLGGVSAVPLRGRSLGIGRDA